MTRRFVSKCLMAASLFALPSFAMADAAADLKSFNELKADGYPSEIQETIVVSLSSGDVACVQKRDGKTGQVKSTKCDPVSATPGYVDAIMGQGK